jgi:hypothetical protein
MQDPKFYKKLLENCNYEDMCNIYMDINYWRVFIDKRNTFFSDLQNRIIIIQSIEKISIILQKEYKIEIT